MSRLFYFQKNLILFFSRSRLINQYFCEINKYILFRYPLKPTTFAAPTLPIKLSCMKKHLLYLFLCCMLNGTVMAQLKLYGENYRPQFHFTPERNWMNDPNGLVFYKGQYHLFYQYNPFANVWGHMSWGHAVSKDLIHWKQLPVALEEENGIMIFSGSAVVDTKNSSGLGSIQNPPLVAIYTGSTDTLQTQNLAYSTDNGLLWTKYKSNPVLNENKKDFRDPNVFWYAPEKKWIMSLSYPTTHQIAFYSSVNLRDWKQVGIFGPAGDTTGVWECPDLMRVPIYDQPGSYKWVLLTSQNATMQYFVGNFDGKNFTSETPNGTTLKPDYGTDYYAAIAYHSNPIEKPVSIGWVNNWNYANQIPTYPWKGAASLPRTLQLKKINDVWQLIQQPVAALATLRKQPVIYSNKKINKTTELLPFKGNVWESEIIMQPAATGETGLQLAVGNGLALNISYNAAAKQLVINRNNTPDYFSAAFAARPTSIAPVRLLNNELKLQVFFDKSIVEVFVNNGEQVLTVQVFPAEENNGVALYSTGENALFKRVTFWPMKSIW